ncbi:MAG: hypothetical protein ACOYIR_00790 [Christensenellales bacterium]|jgi:hypothetical protein
MDRFKDIFNNPNLLRTAGMADDEHREAIRWIDETAFRAAQMAALSAMTARVVQKSAG